jgi:hypothetical protein
VEVELGGGFAPPTAPYVYMVSLPWTGLGLYPNLPLMLLLPLFKVTSPLRFFYRGLFPSSSLLL